MSLLLNIVALVFRWVNRGLVWFLSCDSLDFQDEIGDETCFLEVF